MLPINQVYHVYFLPWWLRFIHLNFWKLDINFTPISVNLLCILFYLGPYPKNKDSRHHALPFTISTDTYFGLPATSLITHSKLVIAPDFLSIMVKYYHADQLSTVSVMCMLLCACKLILQGLISKPWITKKLT